MNADDSKLDKILSAFAIFANDEKENKFEVEIFLPSLIDSSIVLKPIKDDGRKYSKISYQSNYHLF